MYRAFLICAYGPLQTLTSVWLSIFYRFCSRRVWSITDLSFASVGLSVFVRVAYGSLQTLASVGLSVFYRFCSRGIWSITNFCQCGAFRFLSFLFTSHMVHCQCEAFQFLSFLFASRMVHYKLSLVWGFPFIVFVCVAYGPLQTFASVGLSVIYRFWFLFVSHMVHY